ncbi:hypothetical protein BGZ58_008821 [Dissophora ornata]|nr:hypothetical protein BGZ58_008821 [Dissophora ornata]
MQSSSPPKFSLDTLMSTVLPSLDMNVPVDDAPKKFKRSRPPPVAAPPAPAPSQAQTPAHIYKSPLPTDMAIAAAAAFRSDTAAPSPAAPSPMSTSTSAATAATSTNTNKSKSKWNRKRKAGKQGNSGAKTTNPDLNPTALMPETAGSSTNQSGSNNKKSKIYHNAKHQPKNKPAIELDADEKTKKWVRLHRKDPQMITRNLDGTPDAVGVSGNKDDDEDFSTLLLKHVEQSNKMLQRDLELQSKKMLEEQKLQAELLASQAAGFMDPLQQQGGSSAGQPSLLSLEQQPETQMNKQGQIHKKAGGKPFVPWKDCTYFLKGHCPKGETCTFKHDLEARNAQLFKPLPEDARKARGVCKFEKSGSCTKGDLSEG